MKEAIDTSRRQLGELAGLAARTEADERRILQQAEKLLEQVMKDLPGAQSAALGSPADAERFQQLLEERGRLERVIAQARAVLVDEDAGD